ncbi:MAG: HyaD/HybD family hydrogenase maturation endopeptidase [Woeseiaceae bacterium]|nr:HyaD/HybD family hydrogenase maturation endopeptidase [Woeseiaceae bacterium]
MPGISAPHAQEAAWHTLVLGIGNLLYADEGFGVRCVEALNTRFELPTAVRVMDGGTQGIFLLPWVRCATRLLLFDAIDFGLAPASLRLITGDDVPRFMGAKKVSMHQAGFQEVLASASLAGELPAELALVGVQPAVLNDYGGSLTPGVRAQIEPALGLALAALAHWGVAVTERPRPPAVEDLTGPGALDIGAYEAGRPGGA